MDAVFLKLLNMSFTASFLILAVILLRFALKKAPKWARCVLWALVAVRLVCPVGVSSPLSVFNAVNAPVNDRGEVEYVRYIGGSDRPMAVPDAALLAPYASVEQTEPQAFLSDEVRPIARASDAVDLPPLTALWLAGAAALLLYAVVSSLHLRRKVRASVRLRENIYLCDDIDSPFILGIVRPRIYLPSGLDDAALRSVVAHENAHIRRRDHWWKPLGFLLLAVYWFNPLIWLAYVLLCRDIELACDEKVIRDMEQNERADYSQALLDCGTRRRLVMLCPLAFGEVGVKERVKSVLNYKKPAFWLIAVAVLACVVVGVCFLTNPAEAENGNPASNNAIDVANPSFELNGAEYPRFPVLQDFLDRGWKLEKSIETIGDWSEEEGPTNLVDTGFRLTSGDNHINVFLNVEDLGSGAEPAACRLRSLRLYGEDVESFRLRGLELSDADSARVTEYLGDSYSTGKDEYGQTLRYSLPEDSISEIAFSFPKASGTVSQIFVVFIAEESAPQNDVANPSFELNGAEYPRFPVLQDFLDRGWKLEKSIETMGDWSEEKGPTNLVDTGFRLTSGDNHINVFLNVEDLGSGAEPAACRLRSLRLYGEDVESFRLRGLELSRADSTRVTEALGESYLASKDEYGQTLRYALPEDSISEIAFSFPKASETVSQIFVVFIAEERALPEMTPEAALPIDTDEPFLTVTSGGENVAAYPVLWFEQTWTENGWLFADGVPWEMVVQQNLDKIPTLTLGADFQTTFGGGAVRMNNLKVYAEDFTPLREYMDGNSAVNWLEPGTYWCVLGAHGPQGAYVASEDKYEQSGYRCVFRLDVTASGPAAYTPEEVYDLTEARLNFAGTDIVLTDAASLAKLENWLRNAEELAGGAACPFSSMLYLARADGKVFSLCPAEDSCGAVLAGETYYRYAWDNGEFWALFGLNPGT